jgi:hypothetical protein
MKVLVACEFSGVVRDAFIKRGHDAMSCDILPSESSGPHHTGDVIELLNQRFDLMIAHPPCTYLTNSGVKHLHTDLSRWFKLFEAAEFFKKLLNAPNIKHIAVENPIMHRYAREIIGERQSQIVQPWMFGHTESKATGFWLKNLPPLFETMNVKQEMQKLPKKDTHKVHYASPGKDRWKNRSVTCRGIADAAAAQWGEYISMAR